ncbi:glycosyltransferase N-terminal domain-containing protein [Daejeonella sp. H1SJ63]|uniref:3-deoxy-D-manno-octulosonic acid transferase n=1 Tax=Daejeonella sp. H1SJ63 TaxID=3034145 RepID=UPI0023EDD910|nr:glycosyltransferase N-terminal domain-containing protein [Daejeonella sp. H1SJ63]
MLFLYDLGIRLYILFIRIASVKNKKAKLWINGRKDIFDIIKKSIDPSLKYTWFHFASLGEFEQGRPVIEQMKKERKECSIVVTFFSPSGYEVRKNYPLADHVFYLPADTAANARTFIRLLNPEIAIFTKYEYWYHYFEELNNQNIPLYIISGIFREEQAFFKWYGTLHRRMLGWVSHFFVQNEISKTLLGNLGINNVTVSGDTRFDRVKYNSENPLSLSEIEVFSKENEVFIAGSTWPEDEKLIAGLAVQYPDWRFIIAPHEVNEKRIAELKLLFPESVNYSGIKGAENLNPELKDSRILIIDSIGILSSVYRYGVIAYIGGGFGVGIHNTLEAAAFGIPVIFGPNYSRFQEAVQLIEKGGAFSIESADELKLLMNQLKEPEFRKNCGVIAGNYVRQNTGASRIFLDHISST